MIELRQVVKAFETVTAVGGVTLDVAPGRIVGLLGHNGAGKTTLIRMVAGLLAPDGGTVRVAGLDPVADGTEVRRRVGVLPSSQMLDGRLTGAENLRFAGRLHGIDPVEVERRARPLLVRFGLADRLDDKVSTLSAGLRQRLALVRVLMPEPEALLLDEPSSAVDPVATREIRDLLTVLARERGTAVVLATHDLDEAGDLCDELLILAGGRALAQGPLDRVAEQLQLTSTLVVHCDVDRAPEARDLVGRVDPTAAVARAGLIEARGTARARVPEVVRLLAGAGIDVYGVELAAPSLEDLYFHLHSGGPNGNGPPPPPAPPPPTGRPMGATR